MQSEGINGNQGDMERLMRDAIRGPQRPSEALKGHQRPSKAIEGQ